MINLLLKELLRKSRKPMLDSKTIKKVNPPNNKIIPQNKRQNNKKIEPTLIEIINFHFYLKLFGYNFLILFKTK